MRMTGPEVRRLELVELAADGEAKQGVAAVHHRRKRDQHDDGEQLDGVVHSPSVEQSYRPGKSDVGSGLRTSPVTCCGQSSCAERQSMCVECKDDIAPASNTVRHPWHT